MMVTKKFVKCDAESCEEVSEEYDNSWHDDAIRADLPLGWRSIDDFDFCEIHAEERTPYRCEECDWIMIVMGGDEPEKCWGCEHEKVKKIDWEFDDDGA